MEKTVILIVAVLAVLGVAVAVTGGMGESGTGEYNLYCENPVDDNWLGLEPFYLANYIYDDIFYPFGLMDRLELTDRATIVYSILQNLSYDDPIMLEVPNYKHGKDLLFLFALVDTPEGEQSILMLTNYDMEEDRVLSFNEEPDGLYGCNYFIEGSKLVSYFDLYSVEIEQNLQDANSLNNLADFYLFDDNVTNDQNIEELLIQEINKSDTPAEKFIPLLTLAQYYTSVRDTDKFMDTLQKAENIYNTNPELKKDDYAGYSFQSTEEVFFITNEIEQDY